MQTVSILPQMHRPAVAPILSPLSISPAPLSKLIPLHAMHVLPLRLQIRKQTSCIMASRGQLERLLCTSSKVFSLRKRLLDCTYFFTFADSVVKKKMTVAQTQLLTHLLVNLPRFSSRACRVAVLKSPGSPRADGTCCEGQVSAGSKKNSTFVGSATDPAENYTHVRKGRRQQPRNGVTSCGRDGMCL